MIIKADPIQDVMFIFNFAILMAGLALSLRYNPMNYGCNLVWHSRFKMSLFILTIGIINMVYFWMV
jgi:hypothetical protein